LFSAGTAGYFVAMARANGWLAQQREDSIQNVQSLQAANAQLIDIIKRRLPEITVTVDGAAKTAKEAADTAMDAIGTAKGAAKAANNAGLTARQAASTAKSAATKASEAAADVKDAVTPQPVEPKDPPAWLGGS